MSFQPAIPGGSVAGWNFIQRTAPQQKAALAASGSVAREQAYFREKIGTIATPEQLVADFTLLKVALAAFGLQDDQQNKYFIRTVLAEGSTERGSLANRLSDPRYKALTDAFGFASLAGPNTARPSFADRILSAHTDQTLEVSVGEANPALRLALGLDRELERVLNAAGSDAARWFGVMGSPPLRKVFEGALGLPDSFATLDIDQQLGVFRERSERLFGTTELGAFAAPDMREALRSRFLVLSDVTGAQAAQTSPVLALFANQPGSGAAGLLNSLYG